MKARVNRREVTRWMFSTVIGSLASTKLGASMISGSGADDANFQSIRSQIHQSIARGDATGVAVSVVHGGRIVWEEGFGWANQEARLRATPHTPFSMASLTKPFTATTIMTLVAEGKLSLDEPANRYLKQNKLIGMNGNPDAATVRLLGAHASGLPGIYESYDANEARLVPTPNAMIRAYGRLAYPPATCYEYSNIGFAVLNAIASNLTQTELGILMHRKVLGPLGLNDSFFDGDANRLRSSATRYDAHGRLIPHYTTSTPASGGLYSSAHDLARFALFNMRHREGQPVILSDEHIDELHRPVFTGPSGVATTFGWFKSHTASGVPFFLKSGGDPGVANRMCFVPSKDLACIVITNRSNGWELACSVCDEVIANYLTDWRRPDEDCGFPSKPFILTSAFQGQWEGVLEDGGASTAIHLNFKSNEVAMLTVGNDRTEIITEMRAEGEAFTGISTGQINSPDAIRTGARTLQIKLLPDNNRLIGRVFAVAGDPNVKNVRLPYVLRLHRS